MDEIEENIKFMEAKTIYAERIIVGKLFLRFFQIFILGLLVYMAQEIVINTIAQIVPELIKNALPFEDAPIFLFLGIFILFLGILPVAIAKLGLELCHGIEDSITELKALNKLSLEQAKTKKEPPE